MSAVLRKPFFTRLAGFALLGASLVALLAQCTSGPDLRRVVAVHPDDRIVVIYEQPRRDFAQSLLSETVVDPDKFYSSTSSDPFAKVLSTDGMQILLDGLATAGYFDDATAQAVPGAMSNLHVRVNDDIYALSMHAGMTADAAAGFNRCMATFQNVYNATTSFHVMKGDDNSLIEQHDRLEARRREYFEKGKGKQ